MFSLYKNNPKIMLDVFLEPLSTLTQKMYYWHKSKNPRRGKGKKTHGKTGDGRQLGQETDGRTGTLNHPLEGL